ncbi:serine-rich coiled-coil domain-containing protein 1 [Protopterus annectens]|uniref:serine-rich coiled-coil domain-containing protein 1 n=1 Tax=Protopterus annectens TaxID=7888 RepID=UPI001CFAADE2|nr:serine-rich coiled-coil domain-containing protein 1 [Protopterus annectens]
MICCNTWMRKCHADCPISLLKPYTLLVLMGDSVHRRSTLVSRLPIFRRSTVKRQDTLPSSPSSSNGNGLHTSSPSSTNSSSSSAGKRRSIFRTPSLAFHSKKGTDQKSESRDQNSGVSNGTHSTESSLQKLELEENCKNRSRHSFGFSGSRSKKITRSATEDFEKEKEHSGSRSVFINCLSSGKHENDDSGFTEENNKRSAKTSSRKLIPRSFSSQYKFAKQTSLTLAPPPSSLAHTRSPKNAERPLESETLTVQTLTAHSVELTDSTLESPLLSTEHTTLPTPSEFFPLTEDCVSEAAALINCGNSYTHTEDIGHCAATSQVSLTPDALPVPDQASCDMYSPTQETKIIYEEEITDAVCIDGHVAASQTEALSWISDDKDSLIATEEQVRPPDPVVSEKSQTSDTSHIPMLQQALPEPQNGYAEFVANITKASETKTTEVHKAVDCQSPPNPLSNEAWHSKVTPAYSFSPCQEDKFMERRLRSASEGTAGSSRIQLKLKETFLEGVNSLRRQRAGSSSSKMNSMDVLNNLGSCDLEEDDLMLDLEISEETHRQQSVCREDSYNSIESCSAVLLSSTDTKRPEESKRPESTKVKKSDILNSRDGFQEPVLYLERYALREQLSMIAVSWLTLRAHNLKVQHYANVMQDSQHSSGLHC